MIENVACYNQQALVYQAYLFQQFGLKLECAPANGWGTSQFVQHTMMTHIIHTHTHIHTYIHTYIYIYIHTYIHIYIYIYIYLYIIFFIDHTHIYVYIYK